MLKLTLKILVKLKLIKYFNFNITKLINGVYYKIPLINGNGNDHFFDNEIWMSCLINDFYTSSTGSFVDVGANLGQTLLAFQSSNVLNNAYVGFEPNQFNTYYLHQLIKINNLKECNIIPCSISRNTALTQLLFISDNDTDQPASILKEFRPEHYIYQTHSVMTISKQLLNKFFENKLIGFIKIDVEGAELEVLEAFTDLILAQKPPIYLEILPAYRESNTFRIENQINIISLLKRLDYNLFRIDTTNPYELKYNKITTISIDTSIEQSDYLALPTCYSKSKDHFLY